MSTISAANGAGPGLFQYLRKVADGSRATPAQQPTATGDASGTPQTAPSSDSSGTVRARGHHHRGGGGFRAKIESAVSSALQAAKSGGDNTDVNQVIQDAISKVLKDGPGHAPPAGGGGPTQGAAPSAPAQGAGQGPDAAAGTPSPAGSAQDQADSFGQLLQQFGVSRDQFRNDLQAAFQKANGGAPDLSSAFKRFPPGTDLDTHA